METNLINWVLTLLGFGVAFLLLISKDKTKGIDSKEWAKIGAAFLLTMAGAIIINNYPNELHQWAEKMTGIPLPASGILGFLIGFFSFVIIKVLQTKKFTGK